MIRTIVVDDEPYIRKSIVTSIESIHPDFHVIAEAEDGLQAYHLIAELHPDVVFLDIRMPVMDGISLLEKLWQNQLSPIRVILSGYSEFEYAKKAIQYEVLDYILKPLHIDQLTQLLTNISHRIVQKQSEQEYQYLNYIFRGVKPSFPPDNLKKVMDPYKVYYCFYMIAGSYMYTKYNQFNPEGNLETDSRLFTEISENYSPKGHLWFISGENQNEILFIFGAYTEDQKLPEQMSSELYRRCRMLPVPVTFVYASLACALDQLTNTVIDMKYFATQKLKYAHSSIMVLEEIPMEKSETVFIKQEKFTELKTLLQEQCYQEFKQKMKLLLLSFQEQQLTQQQLKTELIRLLEVFHNNYFSVDVQDFIDESITNTYSYDDLIEILLQYIDDCSQKYYQDLSQTMTEQIRDYIDERYCSQLTLKDIAGQFHISASYLSTLFKKAYHISPNEYIMNKRIAKARDLLTAFPPVSIKQISSIIGYTDPFYFSRIFKTVTGQTPTDYRNSKYKESK